MGEWPDRHVAKCYGISRPTVTRWRNRLHIRSRRAQAADERAALVPGIQKQVDAWRRRFRLLEGWEIHVIHDLECSGEVKSIDLEHKRATLYTIQGLPTDECDKHGVPLDYALHEVLHVAWKVAQSLGPKEGEEILIQDLCEAILPLLRLEESRWKT